jgi:hypothetical protein
VYSERLSRVFYQNYIGSIVDWYSATLFRREPVLTFEGPNEAAKRFFCNLVEDVDQKGTQLADFFRRQFIDALITGASYTLVDFPRLPLRFGTRGEEDALGASRAYLVDYAADDLINWNLDNRGGFEWVVLRTASLKKDRIEDPNWQIETRWLYYDRQTFRIYTSAGEAASRETPRLVDQAREDGIEIGVTGMDEFDIADFSTELNDAEKLLALGMNSPTLKKEVFKRLALKYLSDTRQDVKDKIAQEIETERSES